jgi:hypothetical protein
MYVKIKVFLLNTVFIVIAYKGIYVSLTLP